jgi:hypothetical protein
MGLVEENAGLAPSSLFVTPIGEFGGNYRVDIGPDLRIAEQIGGLAGRLEQRL